MAIFKCKMCGGDLNVTESRTVIECDYCGTSQTIPAADNEKKINLFNRANRLRFRSEFDKAEALYESIISEFPEEAEAYWGLCLCKYGIEYVDDPLTGRKIPTCHRTSFKSIFDDESYKLAIEYADVVAQKLYRDEARAIDTLQRDILQVVNTVEPYDVFICYKETGEDGQRTHDSVLAQDIYDSLTEKGLKVFFARITLEDKLGTAYEPYIFAALNSAKVMLAVGTKYEHFNAVWVKNEWSRYLDFMKSDRKRVLIPCYKDIDPYDLPEEFRNLQAQDMNKIGAMQDLVRGVLKIIQPAPAVASAPVQQPVARTSNTATVDSLLQRAFMFLEDGDRKSAFNYFEKVLDIDPECAEAYLGKLMFEMEVSHRQGLAKCCERIIKSENYKKIMRFGNAELVNELKEYVYTAAGKLASSNTTSDIENAISMYNNISDWKDSKVLSTVARNRISEIDYQYAVNQMNKAKSKKEFISCAEMFKKLRDYQDSANLAAQCRLKASELEQEERENKRIQQRNAERDSIAATIQQLRNDIKDDERRLKSIRRTSIAPFVLLILFVVGAIVLIGCCALIAYKNEQTINIPLFIIAVLGLVIAYVSCVVSGFMVGSVSGGVSLFIPIVGFVCIFIFMGVSISERKSKKKTLKSRLEESKMVLAQYEDQLKVYGG